MKNEKDNASSMLKSRFKPKMPVFKRKAAAVKFNKSETKGEIVDKELLAKLNSAKVADGSARKPNIAAPAEVVFGQGGPSTIRKYGHPTNAVAESNHEDDDPIIPHARSLQKEYIEPWDCENSMYPITLPLRQPNLGDPEILDRNEFVDDLNKEKARKNVTPAEELGLVDANDEPELLFFQLPKLPPFIRPAYGTKSMKMENAKAGEGKDILPGANKSDDNTPSLNHLPSGRLGKMIVYKSGKIKMKIGDMLFDVSPGQSSVFAQDVAAVSVKERKCSIINSINKRAVVTPDIDFLLESSRKL